MINDYEEKIEKIHIINKSLDILQHFLIDAAEEEKQQIYATMEYLEQQYKKLEDSIVRKRVR